MKKTIRYIWNILIFLMMISVFKENTFFQKSLVTIAKCVMVNVNSAIDLIKDIPTNDKTTEVVKKAERK